MRLPDKVAIVTGGGSGIGEAIALRFAAEGSDVVVPDLKLAAARETAARIEAMGRQSMALAVDVSRSAEVREMVAAVIGRFGRIDVLVNNAGIGLFKSISNISDEDWNRTLAVNLTGGFYCIREVLPQMRYQGNGKIINIASVNAVAPIPGSVAYASSKGGIITMTKAVALELAGTGISVNAIAPGFVATPPMASYYRENVRMANAVRTTSPHGRCGEPEEVAAAALYLASDEASWVNGTTLFIDGGFTAGKLF